MIKLEDLKYVIKNRILLTTNEYNHKNDYIMT